MATNTLFNQPLMNKYIKKYKKELTLTHSRKEAVFKWINKLEKGELKEEVANYGSFSRIILENILGYDYEKNIEENVKEDYGRGLSEFALKKQGQKFMVIELKGSDADLDKPQNRKADKRTPVDQAFDYAKRSGDIDWICVSNYNEFRLYNWHQKQHKFISFKAEELKDPETFIEFMLVFSKFSIIDNNLIEKLVSKTIFVERNLESEFYKLYNETRLMIIAELEQVHSEFTREQSVHYAQLILNRYIFICFAEDLGLLPGEISVESIENPVKNNNLGRNEIWHRLNSLFIDINEGNDFKKIYAYNGGLFSEDIEYLKIRDTIEDHSIFKDAYQKWKFEEYSLAVEEKLSPYSGKINPIYKNLMTISTFNFSSEVDVNILGHIFENSIGDIEELKANTKGRRKKDGIFYTPEYITDYICRNTIIPYLSKSGKIDTVEALIKEYSWATDIENLDSKLKAIKIVDPACGSGAFLNKATDILLDIHKSIYDFKQAYTTSTSMRVGKGSRRRTESVTHFDLGAIVFDDIEKRREILLDNIFGVDLNEESIEITKLSLFLKVCKKGLKLPNLDKNIKCGNSLIDDPEYSPKYFDWEEEFKEIFNEGGFNIVIGNPPYVRMEKFKEIKPFLKTNYATFAPRADLFVYFFEKGINILNKMGKLGFISSNKFIKSEYGKKLREFILENTNFERYIDHTYDEIFEDATTYPSVFIFNKGDLFKENTILVDDTFQIEQSRLTNSSWSFEKPEVLDLRDKINQVGLKVKEVSNLNIYYGIKTGFNEAFIINEEIKNKLLSNPDNKQFIKPIVRGKDIKKWKINFEDLYIILIKYGEGGRLEEINHPIYLYLKKYEKKLKARGQVKNGQHHWLELDNNPSDKYLSRFKGEKLIYPNLASSLFAVFDKDGFYTNQKCFIITSENENLKFLSCLLSSNLLNFIFKFLGTPLQGNYYDLNKKFIEELPIYPAILKEQKPFIEKADYILKINNDLINEIESFKGWLKRTYKIDKFSKKLDKYYDLSFEDFLIEIKKKKVDIKPRKTQELLKNEFEESLNKVNPLIDEIRIIDSEINKMVYELYDLTEYEIEIIENSLKK
ncbi:MAG: Eco57I restriction-modification methylase domain-containing protein [Methanobacteriaceae archaeon]|nr:Eco57I restriction-modification methylase domain-containing protein [Methanobacteriaceae archaeon]